MCLPPHYHPVDTDVVAIVATDEVTDGPTLESE